VPAGGAKLSITRVGTYSASIALACPPGFIRLRRRRSSGDLDHPVQVRRRDADVVVVVLGGPHLRAQHRTAMDVAEVAERVLVARLGLLAVGVVDAEVPARVLAPACASMNAFSCAADGRCSLQASRSSCTAYPSLIARLAKS
jgi:hypothetical protein